MKKWFADLPVQQKLGYAMLFTSTVASLLACGVFLVVEYVSDRGNLEQSIATLARITANNSSAAIAFGDPVAARQNLESLSAEPQVIAATLYDYGGRVLARYDSRREESLPGSATAVPGLRYEQGRLVVVQTVMEGDRRLGTLHLQATLGQIYARMRVYSYIIVGVLATTFGLIWLIASGLQRTLARPILELASTAIAISTRQDYSLRARQHGNDELGRLTATFNAMLERTQAAVDGLRESEWAHRELVRALPAAVYMCDAQGMVTLCNEAAVKLWGRAPVIGQEYWCGSHRMLRPDGSPLPLEQSPLAVALREGRPVRGEEVIIDRPDGTRRNVLPHPEPLRDTTGRLIGIVNMLVDITEEKLANAAARQLAAIVESSDDAIIGKDLEGVITAWNKGAERLYGYTSAEMIGQPVALLIPLDRLDEEPNILRRIRNNERIEHYETVRRRRDGSLVDVSLTVSPIKDQKGRIVGASKIARDITERKLHAETLRENEAQLRLVTDNAPILLVRMDRNYAYTFVNRAYAERNGFTAAEMVGMKVRDVLGPQAFESVCHRMDEALAGARVEFELVMPYERLGRRWIHVIYVPERDAGQRVTGLLGVITDIGARKQAEIELERARDEALAASRAKDDFLAALSHELRTPLNPVLLLASAAATNPDLPAPIRADFDLILKNVNLEARLIDDLLDLTRITHGKLHLERRRCNVHTILQDALATVESEVAEKKLQLEVDFAAPVSRINGDSVRLQQIFWNLLKNAVKFTPMGGKICVRSSLDATRDMLVIRIADSGIGMSGEEIGRIFQAFSQGDHASGGTGGHRFGGLGLGLAITKRLVELHDGRIRAVSDGHDLGSVFEVDLPIWHETQAKTPRTGQPAPFQMLAATNPQTQPASPRRILLVEDHAPTRQTMAHLLKLRHFEVVAAESATEAGELALTHEFDLVISDVGLPDRSGYELMAELHTRHPFLPGIALSGYGMEEDLQRSRAAGFGVHLVKPVTIGMLEDAIASLPPATECGNPREDIPSSP